jgi:hypothetical protein
VPDPFCGRGGTGYAPGRESGERKLVRVQVPPPAPISSRRGWNGDTVDSKPAGRNCPCRCKSGRRDQLCGRAWNSRPGGLKNRCAAQARGRASRPGRTPFRPVVECIHASLRNSWAKARAGANPVSPTIFDALSSNEHRRPASQAGNAGAIPVEATIHRRVVQSEPSAL